MLSWVFHLIPYEVAIVLLALKLRAEPADEFFFGQEMILTALAIFSSVPYMVLMILIHYTSVLDTWAEPFHLDLLFLIAPSAAAAAQVVFPIVVARRLKRSGSGGSGGARAGGGFVGGSLARGRRVAAMEAQAAADAQAMALRQAHAASAVHVDGGNLESILGHPVARSYLRQFMRRSFASENILFWEAVTDLRQLASTAGDGGADVAKRCQHIYAEFVSDDAELMVNLSSPIAHALADCKQQGSWHAAMFDAALTQVVAMVRDDLFPRFLASPEHSCMQNWLHQSTTAAMGASPRTSCASPAPITAKRVLPMVP